MRAQTSCADPVPPAPQGPDESAATTTGHATSSDMKPLGPHEARAHRAPLPQANAENVSARPAMGTMIFAMANPVPEIMPDEAKAGGAAVIGTGRSDYPNQINNVLVFPGIFKGALSVRAKEITESMKQKAAFAIASMIPDEELTAENIIPSALDKSVADVVAKAVAETAIAEGIARV